MFINHAGQTKVIRETKVFKSKQSLISMHQGTDTKKTKVNKYEVQFSYKNIECFVGGVSYTEGYFHDLKIFFDLF